jgi:hypothetical protein
MKGTCKKIVEIAGEFTASYGLGNFSSLQNLMKSMEGLRSLTRGH